MGFIKSILKERAILNQYMAAISGSLCYMIVGTATAWPSPSLTKFAQHKAPFILSNSEVSWMVSLMFLGHISSPIPSGYLMDWLGSKRTCLYLAVLPFSSWLLIFFGDSVAYLYIARFAAGLWIGITSTIMPIYVGEIANTELRGSLSTINNLLYNFGVLFAYIIGPFVNYYMLAIACEILTVIYICTFVMMPESPHYFVKKGQIDDAFKALRWLRKGEPQENIENEVYRIERAIEEQKAQTGSLKDIFLDQTNRKAFIISVTYAILKRLSGSGVIQAYLSVTLPALSFGTLDADTCVIIVGTVSLISSIVSTALAARYPRRVLLTVSCGGCMLTTGAMAVWFYMDGYTDIDVSQFSDTIFWSMVLYYIMFNIALGPVGTSIKGEIFSQNVKALSSSLTTLSVAITAFLLNKYYLIIAHSTGMYINYIIYSVSCIYGIVFTWLYVPEMHNRTLEEIREILGGGKKKKCYSATIVAAP